MTKPIPMAKRPRIDRITYISPEGNPQVYQCGPLHRNCYEIREVEENGEYCTIPWLEVWEDEHLVARFNQHKVEHILYRRSHP